MCWLIFSCISGARVRKGLILLLLLLPMCLFSAPSFGYSLAPVGVTTPSGSYGGLTVAIIFSPFPEVHAGDLHLSADFSPVPPFFESAALTLSLPLLSTLRNPFSWAFSNPVLWTPTLTVGAQYRMRDEWNLLLGFSPFAFQDKHFIYEAIAPFAVYSILYKNWGWGMYIFRFSYFF